MLNRPNNNGFTQTVNKTVRVVITGGGTGGHLFPGVALATGLQQRIPGCEVMFIGTERHLDQETLADYNFQKKSISAMGLKGVGVINRIRTLATLPVAVLEAMNLLRTFKPDLVFGVGGYVTGPVLLAARLLSIPSCIHEQNSVAGLANKIISRFTDRIFISLPCDSFPEKKTVLVGNPVRKEILEAATEKKVSDKDTRTVLVLGGSQGAHRINMLMLEAMTLIRNKAQKPPGIIHQTGSMDAKRVADGYQAAGIKAEVAPFFKDVASLYKKADLVVARAGATTLAELSVMGLPSILIPYPYATDDHQTKNAQYYVRGKGARLLSESELTGKRLALEIQELLQHHDRLREMAENMKKMGRPNATEEILTECVRFAGLKTG